MSIQLEILKVFNVRSRGFYVAAKVVDPNARFSITKKSFLGEVELEELLEIPKSTDENGSQRQDQVVLKLKNQEDKDKLTPNSVVELVPGNDLHYMEPWYPLEMEERNMHTSQLIEELSIDHVLFGVKARAVARHQDREDVLYELEDHECQFAIVHLTWAKESRPGFPITKLYKDWVSVYNNCIVPDHEDVHV